MSTDVLQPGAAAGPTAVDATIVAPLPVPVTGAVDATIVGPSPLPVSVTGQPIETDPTDDAARLLGIVSVDSETPVDVTSAALLGAIDGLTEELRQLRELVELLAT